MFGLFKKKEADNHLYAPVSGQWLALKDVKDEVFSSGMLGEGMAFLPEDDIICSPCDGQIVMVADTKHAFAVKADNGAEILVHVGMDTVNLNGEGLKLLMESGSRVKKGDGILKIDQSFMQSRGIDLTTPMIVANGHEFQLVTGKACGHIEMGEAVGTVSRK